MPKSQLVREALEQYLAAAQAPTVTPSAVRERSAPYVGAVRLSPGKERGDPVAGMIRSHNWRD